MFGVGTDKGVIKLFDVRSYAQGPFDAFTVSPCSSFMLSLPSTALGLALLWCHFPATCDDCSAAMLCQLSVVYTLVPARHDSCPVRCRALKQALRLRVHIVWLLHHTAPGKQQPVVMRRVDLCMASVQMLQSTAAGSYTCLSRKPPTFV